MAILLVTNCSFVPEPQTPRGELSGLRMFSSQSVRFSPQQISVLSVCCVSASKGDQRAITCPSQLLAGTGRGPGHRVLAAEVLKGKPGLKEIAQNIQEGDSQLLDD